MRAIIVASVALLLSFPCSQVLADIGAEISYPEALNTNAGSDVTPDENPHVTTDGMGNWVAVWHTFVGGETGPDLDIWVSRSVDNGANWSTSEVLNTNAFSDTGHDGCPRVATDRLGNWVAVWFSWEPDIGGGIGTDVDILVARSTDNGASWSPPEALNTNAGVDSGDDWKPQVTTDRSGNWVVVWYSYESNIGGGIGPDADILVARSADNGASWSPPERLHNNAGSDTDYDYSPQVTTDGSGNWVAVWYSYESNIGGAIGADADILVVRSTDNGATWSPVEALNINARSDNNLQDWEPQITTDRLGNWIAVWGWYDSSGGPSTEEGEDIAVARSTDNGVSWSMHEKIGNVRGEDQEPQIATDGLGNWVAVWQSFYSWTAGGNPTDWDILVARSTDNGANWSLAEALNTNTPTDTGYDAVTFVTTDGAGNWITVWQSAEPDIDGGIGTDADILVARWVFACDENDNDIDGFSECDGDCNDDDPNTYPGAPEINDGVDNQCPGDYGYSVTDETSGVSGFDAVGDTTEYSWPVQPGATLYEVARASSADYSTACWTAQTVDTYWIDTEEPSMGGCYYYLNRPLAPYVGSWGQDSTGVERIDICP